MSKISLDPKYEQQMIERAKVDPEKFAPLYSHYQPHIYRFIFAKLRIKEIAEDLTAQTFEKAIRGIKDFQWQGTSVSAWLYQIAKRLILDYLRAQKVRQNTTDAGDNINFLPGNDSVEVEAEHEVHTELLSRLVQTLSPKERQIIDMKFYKGYSNKLIAQLLHMSESNVGTTVFRVVKKLQEKSH